MSWSTYTPTGWAVRLPVLVLLSPFILLVLAADGYLKGWAYVDRFLCRRLPR